MNPSDLRSGVPQPDEFAGLYRLIAETIPQIVWTARPDGEVDFSNARAQEYAGLDSDRLAGRGWQAVVHPEDLGACLERWAAAVATGAPFSIEYRLRRGKDGAWRWHLGRALPLRDRAGRIVKWFGTDTDIDDQKRAAELLDAQVRERTEALRESEARFHSLADLSADWYWEQDEQFRANYFSQEFESAASSSVPLHLGKTRWELPTVGVSADAWAKHRALLEAHLPFHEFEYQRVNERGETIWMSTSGIPIFDDAGRFRGYRGIGRNITDRKRVEEALRQSSEKYQVLVDSIDGIVWEADPASFAFLFVSRQAERLLGYPARQWIEEPDFWRKHTHPEDVGWAAEFCLRATAEKRNHEFEYRMIAVDGQTVWLRDLVTVVVEHGEVVKLRGVMVDITASKRADQALRDSEERFRELTSLSSDFFWETDSAHRFLMLEFSGRFLGPIPSAYYIGKTRWEIPYVLPDEDGWRRHREMLDAHRPIRGFAIARRARNGEVRYYEVDGDPRFGAGGNFVGYWGVGRDTTERLRVELALRESEQRFQLFMDGLPALAWIKDAKLRYGFINRAHQAVRGIAPERILGRDDFEIWPEPLARMFRASDEAALASKEPIEGTETVPKADGEDGHWLVVKFAVPDRSGGRGVAGIAIDITARVAAERELAQSSARIRGLLRRLTGVQEVERRRIAADLHDLVAQNLTALGIGLENLRNGMTQEQAGQHAPTFENLAKLLNDTMDTVRQTMSDLRPSVLDDYGLRAALESYARQFALRTGLAVTVESESTGPRPAPNVELALFRIAQEALTNAAKHAGASRARVTLAHKGGFLRLSIEDDGVGFAQPSGARAARRGGWGLPLMRERAEEAGGTLRLEFPGHGTRVIAEVPHVDPNHPG